VADLTAGAGLGIGSPLAVAWQLAALLDRGWDMTGGGRISTMPF